MKSPTTIAIIDKPRSALSKIIKIVPYKNGGFAVLAPYHTARKGYLAKIKIDYRKKYIEIPRSEIIEYSARDCVKLSFHKNGFVQFSGEQSGKIISGLDPLTGNLKGLGILLENLLTNPIKSGPTFGVSVWGLSEFEKIRSAPSSNTIVFSEEIFTTGIARQILGMLMQ